MCKVRGCKKSPVNRRGWCLSHYKRWLRHGDPTAGKAHIDANHKYLRDVVFKHKKNECLIWPFSKVGGVATIRWNGRTRIVSRIVCRHVNGPPPTRRHQAAHSCGRAKQGCIAPKHLRWATRKENEADKLLHGTHQLGERNSRAKLTEKDVRRIRRLKGKMLHREIAEKFGVIRQTITRILSGKDWSWLK